MTRVLIGYDGSACADAALHELPLAGLPANTQGLILSVAEVFLPPVVEDDPENQSFPDHPPTATIHAREHAEEKLRAAATLALQGMALVQERFPTWQLQPESRADSAAWGIISRAREWSADLIVVGSHGLSALERIFIGSVSRNVLTDANCSVRVSRLPSTINPEQVRILFPTDGSRSARMVEHAIETRQWPAGTEVRIVSVIDSAISSAAALHVAAIAEWTDPSDTDGQAWIYRMVEATARKLRACGLTVSTTVLHGDPKHCIIDEAERWGAGCIFLGSTGLRGVERFLLGSVSSTVAARAHCSVEVVRRRHLRHS